jgi:aminoglycoside phosphotransferase (APT) family kinase protein
VPDVGPLIASGRDADIFAFGPHRVLRRSRDGRSIETEARIMEHVAGLGYPVPRVHDVLDAGAALVMDRVDGPSMLDDLARRPWMLRRHAATLARLHRRLHEVAAPAWLREFPTAPGARVGHFDLHPLNVLMSPRGPVVIDWTNAAAAPPEADVAMTWVLLASGDVQGRAGQLAVLRAARRLFVRAFLAHFTRPDVAAQLDAVVSYKARDPHMSASEVATMRALARDEGRAASH